ncbi:MAG: DNA-3-methyladenine glycosylase family protein [Acidimicrobiales bacterium]
MPPEATRTAWREGARELATRDPVLADLLDRHGPPDIRPGAKPAQRFEALARAIAFQQLAGKAASSIWGRVQVAVGPPFTPERVLSTGYEALRGAGLSNAKALSMLDLAGKVADGTVQLPRITRRSDDEVVEHLTVVRGIGPWTAHMFLMFDLRRIDVWPTGDYGVRAGLTKAYDLPELPTEKEMGPLGEPFAPYRSVVAWWCWAEADTVTPAS